MVSNMNDRVRFENRELLAQHPGCREYILTVDYLERPLAAMIQTTLSLVPIPPADGSALYPDGLGSGKCRNGMRRAGL